MKENGKNKGEDKMSDEQTNTLPETIWHYTKIGVLEKIFPSKENEEYKLDEKGNPKIRLRFTNCKYSKNDPSESLVLQYLLDLFDNR